PTWASDVRPRQAPIVVLGTLAGAHMLMALVLLQSPWISTVAALAVLAWGLVLAARPSTSHQAIYVAAYLATADVLWRMTGARVFWEYGKYSVVLLLLVIAFTRGIHRGLTDWAALYFILFLPSAIATLQFFGLTRDLRTALSFNLSGPFSLAVAVAFFAGIRRVESLDLTRLMTWMLMPIIGVFTIALHSTVTATSLVFDTNANFVTSGGFGPNQVAALLSLGVLLALILAFNSRDPMLRLGALGVAGVLQLQSFLTFSRGGTFNVLVALAFLGVHYVSHQRARWIFVTVMVGVLVVGALVVLPQLDAWTAGNLSTRFTSLDTTGRQALAEADLDLLKEHPVLGVGPGMAKYQRRDIRHYGVAPHTEFTRALAEHGMFGLAGLIVLCLLAFQAYRLAPTALSKGWVAGLVAWSLAEMTHSAMRIVAISFVFGLACLPFHRWGRPES
ncbi:MAG: O-antigen ligase family protein, partial [Acidobacteriota bacterium]